MTTNQINSYGAGSPNDTVIGKTKSGVSSEDFLKLLSAQMANQDVMNPTDNTQYISQLAQFSSLQAMTELSQSGKSQLDAIETLTQISYAQYGASLVGKNVTVASYDENGKYVETKGVVTNTNFASGKFTVTVNDKKYDLSAVMEVISDSVKTPTPFTTGVTDTGTANTALSAAETNAYKVGVPQSTAKTGTA